MAVQKITSNIINPGASGGATALDAVSGDGTGAMIVPKGTTAERPASPANGYVRYNTTNGALEQYNQNQSLWTNVGELAPTVSSISGTINADTDSTITVSGTNYQTGAIVSITGDAVGGVERQLTTTFVSPTTLTAATNAASVNYTGNASFNVKVSNVSGLNNSLSPAGTVDRDPVWNTSSGSIATIYDSNRSSYSSISVSATDPDGTAVTYSIVSGSLPTGLSLNSSTGAITGTASSVGSDTTSPFTVRATSNSFTADRAFSITVKAPTVISFSYTGGQQTLTVPSATGLVGKIYAWGAGGGGGDYSSGGSGGYAYGELALTSAASYAVIVGGGGAGYYTASAGGGGGGLTGLFSGSSTVTFNSTGRARAILIAGAGGGGSGGSGSNAQGGAGGGNEGNRGYNDGRQGGGRSGGYGGTQSAGGAISPDSGGPYNPGNTAGSDLSGGTGSYSSGAPNNGGFGGGGSAGAYAGGAYGGGGGGSGYFGGGGGQDYYSSAGGGGSGYIGGVTNGTNTTGNDSNAGSANNPPQTGSPYYSSGVGVGNYQAGGGAGKLVVVY